MLALYNLEYRAMQQSGYAVGVSTPPSQRAPVGPPLKAYDQPATRLEHLAEELLKGLRSSLAMQQQQRRRLDGDYAVPPTELSPAPSGVAQTLDTARQVMAELETGLAEMSSLA